MFRLLLLAFSFWLTATAVEARQSLPLDTGYTEISLVSDYDTVAPGQSFTVALRMEFEGNWYTYWRNAGDSGEPVNIVWELPAGVTAGPIQWPTPTVKTVGPIVSYAMGGDVWLPIEISFDETVNSNLPITLKAHAYFLVCDDLCVPEDGALTLPIGVGATQKHVDHFPQIRMAETKVPQLGSARGSASLIDGKVEFNFANLPNGFEEPALFPHENPIIVHSDPVILSEADAGLRYFASPSYGWDEGTPSGFDVTLVSKDGEAIVVRTDTDERVDIGAIKTTSTATKTNFLGAAIGAFLGGLILNLMPCVFPIISLKALSLTKTAHGERSAIRRSAWAYTAGVIVSFLIFAGILVTLKSLGSQVGWGFQLQSPWMVALLSLLLFAIGLNLLGVFEVSGRFQNVGAQSLSRAGPFSSFLTGVLAVIVATPCSGPFMAGAVGVALTVSVGVTFVIFLALALGFALPFLLVAYVPGLLSKLPKPGAWMETFRQFLAFPMFASAAFFVSVYSQQVGASDLFKLLLGGVALTFAIWAWGKKGKLAKAFAALMFLAAGIFAVTSALPDGSTELEAQPWSAEAVSDARLENRPVFVDFTAAWCVTCKVNEGLVLKTKKTQSLFDRTDTEFLVADWTNKDDVIAAELERFGRAGVPLYLVYKPGLEEPEILPQILTYEILETALE